MNRQLHSLKSILISRFSVREVPYPEYIVLCPIGLVLLYQSRVTAPLEYNRVHIPITQFIIHLYIKPVLSTMVTYINYDFIGVSQKNKQTKKHINLGFIIYPLVI